ncbi:MAG: hypothetical protein COV31_01545 [Candidatus Yanofskybacteria bacterium CG10_big_fil_rev_8_21_14_0_10_46_23]|uniref:Dipeptidylpeptidase IV N-terminal domain-containing protein n=1 Tax=Candidatus Yanofskybacteria bacterium CG10_big_fil_rev_8_21_14_0_10_46_23 TaxID=1975098 RepID=A0A2H0R4C0_9BACT|nr:MAG: hypothetical protein COV31_01545 [Candidatus Yanofskybacteria bacterium CG10_big_fil_rev_8_21_14_0_10_46_23]
MNNSLIVITTITLLFLGGVYLIKEKSDSLANLSEPISLSSLSILKKAPFSRFNSESTRAADSKGLEIIQVNREGQLLQSSVSGGTKILQEGLGNISHVVWAKNEGSFIYKADGPTGGSFYYDAKSRKTTPLHSQIGNIAFSPDKESIAYSFFDPGANEGSISVGAPDGSSYKNIFKTRMNELEIFWPQTNIIAFKPITSASSPTDLFFVNIENKKLSRVITSKIGLEILFSPSGKLILFSTFTPIGLELHLLDLDAGKEYIAPFPAFAKKCAFSPQETRVYCAVAENPPNEPIRSDYFSDSEAIMAWSPLDNQSEQLLGATKYDRFQIKSPFLGNNGEDLFFINSRDNFVYRLHLN